MIRKPSFAGLSPRKKFLFLLLLVLVGLGGIFFLLNYMGKSPAMPRTGAVNPAVVIYTVQTGDLKKSIRLTGQTVPEAQVDIAAKYSGRISAIYADLGSPVQAGQALVQLDTTDIDTSIQQASAGLRQSAADTVTGSASFQSSYAKARTQYDFSVTNYNRYQALYTQGAISRSDLDNARQNMDASKAALDAWTDQISGGSASTLDSQQAAADKSRYALEALQNQRQDFTLYAPRSGVIAFRQAEVGAMVTPGQKLLTLVDNSRLYFDSQVSEEDIAQLSLNMPIQVVIDSLGLTLPGHINYISPAALAPSQSFQVRVQLDSSTPTLKSGLFARADLEAPLRSQVLLIPADAFITQNGKTIVYVLDDNNKAAARTITLGARSNTQVEVTGGLKAGDRIAATNLARLKTGTQVVPLEPSAPASDGK